jgi:hypothetical protein
MWKEVAKEIILGRETLATLGGVFIKSTHKSLLYTQRENKTNQCSQKLVLYTQGSTYVACEHNITDLVINVETYELPKQYELIFETEDKEVPVFFFFLMELKNAEKGSISVTCCSQTTSFTTGSDEATISTISPSIISSTTTAILSSVLVSSTLIFAIIALILYLKKNIKQMCQCI